MLYLTPKVYLVLPARRRGNLLALLNLVIALGRETGACSPSQPWLAERCGVSVPTVRRCEKELARLELVECDHHARGNRRILRPMWARLREIAGATPLPPTGNPGRSAITSARTVENRVRGARAHSEREWKRRSDPIAARDSRPAASTALERARDRVVHHCGIAQTLKPHAAELVRTIVKARGEERAARWLAWLAEHNGRHFDEVDRRGKVTLGALRKAAEWHRAGPTTRAPRRLCDLLTAFLPFGARAP